MPEGALYVGRGTRWGNPFLVHHGHTIAGPIWSDVRSNWGRVEAWQAVAAYVTSSEGIGAADVAGQFEMLMKVRQRDEPDRLEAWLTPLKGKDLACWCAPGDACHADVLLELANGDQS
jgi:hypothetical protein